MFRFSGFLCAAALAALALHAPAGAAELTLRFGSINAAGTSSFDEVLVPFAKALEAQSDNRLAFDLKPIGGYGKPVDLFPMVEKGEIEIAASVQGYHPGRFPRTSVMDLPMMYTTAEGGTNTLWSLFEEGLLGNEYDSVKVLALYTLPPYGIFLAPGQTVERLKDLRGLRIRAPGVTGGLALARLGAIPIGLPLNLIGPTLKDKLVDGIAYGWDSVMTTKGADDMLLGEQVATMIDANFAAPTLMVVMNRKSYEALPADLRKLIDAEAGLKFSKLSAQIRDRQEVKAKEQVANSPKHRLIKLTPDDKRELEQRITPVFDEWVAAMKRQGVDGTALLARARALGLNS